jgi:pimeloyl-ACP methyl ester carboxylesterase
MLGPVIRFSSLDAAVTTLRLLRLVNSQQNGQYADIRQSVIALPGENQRATLFEPKARLRRTIVLVHGVTGRADADPLLVHLARSLGKLGYRSIAPALRHISHFRHDPGDVQTIVDAILAGHRLDSDGVTILAFSYGASFALSALADASVAKACSAMVGFGAYFELAEALEHQRQLLLEHPNPEQDDADIAYLRYTLLACHRDELGLPSEAWAAIDPILVSFTSRLPIEQKRAPLLHYARHIDYVALMESYQQRDISPRMSPARTLNRVRCRVGLLHDPNDRFVPASHADRIRQVLDARPGVHPTQVLTTPMLSHVQVDPLQRLFDLPQLIRLLEPVLAQR